MSATEAKVSLRDLLSEIAEERGVDFRGYKHSTLERRIERRLFQLKLGNLARYRDFLRENPGEVTQLLQAVLINVTEFFRDPQSWSFLSEHVLPNLLRRHNEGDAIRMWSAGCATGEEAYSLAILVAEHFGERLKEFDIKIYATDMDEQALNVARRAQYSTRQLRHVKPRWRKKYLQEEENGTFRVVRDIRRMVIFGLSNLPVDAPISHVDLLICRNVLIYFTVPMQTQILLRLHYALQPNGVLFLGNSESLLSHVDLFEPIFPKYRLFRKTELANTDARLQRAMTWTAAAKQRLEAAPDAEAHDALAQLQLYQSSILETVRPGILVLDGANRVVTHNDAATKLWGITERIAGRPLLETAIAVRSPELKEALAHLSAEPKIVQFNSRVGNQDGNEKVVEVTVRPIVQNDGQRSGSLVYAEDVSHREKLQQTVQELESTGRELQATNEELEATNEELQSTNEELETINEELQSANEELETTNEELQSLNEELATTNEELEMRSRDLDVLNSRYAETLELMPWPVMLVNADLKIQFWNTHSQRLFGFVVKPEVQLSIEQLPMQEEERRNLLRRIQTAMTMQKSVALKVAAGPHSAAYRVQLSPLQSKHQGSVLVMFEPVVEEGDENDKGNKKAAGKNNR